MGIIISINGADFEPYHQLPPTHPLIRSVQSSKKVEPISEKEGDEIEFEKILKNQKTKKYIESIDKLEKQFLHPRRAKDLMSSPVLQLTEDQKIHTARKLMAEKEVRHFPIVNSENKIVGILSDRNLVFAERNHLVSEHMTKDIIAGEPHTLIKEIAQAMVQYKISSLPILNEEKEVLGIVTTTDLLEFLTQQKSMEFWA